MNVLPKCIWVCSWIDFVAWLLSFPSCPHCFTRPLSWISPIHRPIRSSRTSMYPAGYSHEHGLWCWFDFNLWAGFPHKLQEHIQEDLNNEALLQENTIQNCAEVWGCSDDVFREKGVPGCTTWKSVPLPRVVFLCVLDGWQPRRYHHTSDHTTDLLLMKKTSIVTLLDSKVFDLFLEHDHGTIHARYFQRMYSIRQWMYMTLIG